MWRDCTPYLYGIDLFNHGYWWEAHESLEAVWVAAGRHSETGLFIQGLIQISAAHLKRHQGYRDAAVRLATDGLDKAGHVPGKHYLGIDVPRLCKNVQAWLEEAEPLPVVIELEFGRSASAG